MRCGAAMFAVEGTRSTDYRLNELSARELRALTLVEAGVALGWIASRWPGLLAEIRRVLPDLAASRRRHGCRGDAQPRDRVGAHRARAERPSAAGHTCRWRTQTPQGLSDKLRRSFGRMPWTTTQKRLPRPYSVPVGGDGGVRNPNLPPPSRPQDNDLDITPEHRPGIPYPEWNTLDEELHAGPRRGSRARAYQSRSRARCRAPPICGNGLKNTPIGR